MGNGPRAHRKGRQAFFFFPLLPPLIGNGQVGRTEGQLASNYDSPTKKKTPVRMNPLSRRSRHACKKWRDRRRIRQTHVLYRPGQLPRTMRRKSDPNIPYGLDVQDLKNLMGTLNFCGITAGIVERTTSPVMSGMMSAQGVQNWRSSNMVSQNNVHSPENVEETQAKGQGNKNQTRSKVMKVGDRNHVARDEDLEKSRTLPASGYPFSIAVCEAVSNLGLVDRNSEEYLYGPFGLPSSDTGSANFKRVRPTTKTISCAWG